MPGLAKTDHVVGGPLPGALNDIAARINEHRDTQGYLTVPSIDQQALATFVQDRFPAPAVTRDSYLLSVDETIGFELSQDAGFKTVWSIPLEPIDSTVGFSQYVLDGAINFNTTSTAGMRLRWGVSVGGLMKWNGVVFARVNGGASPTQSHQIDLTPKQTQTTPSYVAGNGMVVQYQNFNFKVTNRGTATSPVLQFQAAQSTLETNAVTATYRINPGSEAIISRVL